MFPTSSRFSRPRAGPVAGRSDAPPASPQPESEPRHPVTPTRQTTTHASSPASPPTPTIPSPLSLFHVGMSPLSPFRRTFPSTQQHAQQPPSTGARAEPLPVPAPDHDGDPESSDSDDGQDYDDSRDVLIQRLADLAARLSQGQDTAVGVDAMHAKMDEMERLLTLPPTSAAGRTHRPRRLRPRSSLMFSRGGSELGGSGLLGRPLSWSLAPAGSFHLREGVDGMLAPAEGAPALVGMNAGTKDELDDAVSLSSRGESAREGGGQGEQLRDGDIDESPAADQKGRFAQISQDEIALLVKGAEALCAELSTVVTSLRARREESDHIHEMLIARAENAAQRIILLEERIDELETDVKEYDAELSSLRLQLRAIEVQCDKYIRPDIDPHLYSSIANWKAEWAELRRQRNLMRTGSSRAGSLEPLTPSR